MDLQSTIPSSKKREGGRGKMENATDHWTWEKASEAWVEEKVGLDV